jgi:four helix bundle protein
MTTHTQNKIQSFTDLTTWQEGHKLVLCIYGATKMFPREEMHSLTDQMRRAATSVTSNIAEGFGRQSQKERVQFYHIANGSLTELKNQLYIARDVGYLTVTTFSDLMRQADTAHRLLHGLLSKTKEFAHRPSSTKPPTSNL